LLFFVLVVSVTLLGMTAVFFGLFSAENANISGIHHDIDALDTDCRYDDLTYAAQQKLEIALGLRLCRNGGELLLNPSHEKNWRFGKQDQVIVLAQQLYQ
jgi:hypothetical protein